MANNYGASSLIRSGWDVQSAGNTIFPVSVRRDRLANNDSLLTIILAFRSFVAIVASILLLLPDRISLHKGVALTLR